MIDINNIIAQRKENEIQRNLINQINTTVNNNLNSINKDMNKNISIGLPSSKININDLISNTLKESKLNSVIKFEEFQEILQILSNKLKTEDYSEYNAFIKTENFKDFIFYKILSNSDELIHISLLFKNDNLNIDPTVINELKNNLIRILFNLFLFFIKNKNEMMLYSILVAYEKIEINDDDYLKNIWDLLVIPISLKNENLLLIKILEIWLNLGLTLDILLQEFKKF